MWGSLAERSAFTSDKEACFKWFAKVLHVALVFARNCGQCMLIHELEMFHVRKNWWIPVWLLTEKNLWITSMCITSTIQFTNKIFKDD